VLSSNGTRSTTQARKLNTSTCCYLVPSEVTQDAFLKGVGDKYHFFLSTADGSAKVDISDGAIHLFTWLIRLHIGLKCG
jgi:hypothetical protein